MRPYVFSRASENKAWNLFYSRLYELSRGEIAFAVDNTNCKQVYIDKIKEQLPDTCVAVAIYFDVPLWKLYIRNILRWWRTGKFIPWVVIKNMKKNFDKLKR